MQGPKILLPQTPFSRAVNSGDSTCIHLSIPSQTRTRKPFLRKPFFANTLLSVDFLLEPIPRKRDTNQHLARKEREPGEKEEALRTGACGVPCRRSRSPSALRAPHPSRRTVRRPRLPDIPPTVVPAPGADRACRQFLCLPLLALQAPPLGWDGLFGFRLLVGRAAYLREVGPGRQGSPIGCSGGLDRG